MKPLSTSAQKACGRYKVAVIDSVTKNVVWQMDEWQHNLILNRGLEEVKNRSWCQTFIVGIAGTSNTPNSRDSGAATIVCDANGTVTLDGGAFTFAGTDVGNILQWDSGSEGRVTHFVDASTVRVTPFPTSGTITPDLFTLYHANRTSLVSEAKRTTTTVVPSPPYTQGVRVDSTVFSRRTWDFTAEAAPITYREVGVGWSATPMAANTTFSRFVLTAPISLQASQQLRLTYQLEVTLSGTQPVVGDIPVAGWPISPSVNTNGTRAVQFVGMSVVLSTGVTSYVDAARGSNEPFIADNVAHFMTSTGTPINAFGVLPPARTLIGTSIVPTQANIDISGVEYYLEKTVTWSTVQNNSGSVRGMGAGSTLASTPPRDCGFIAIFNENQIKQSTDEFTLNLGYRWSRTLVPD